MNSIRLIDIYLEFPDGTVDVSHLLRPDSYTENFSLCSDDMLSTVNSISFSIRYDASIFSKIKDQSSQIGVLVDDRETRKPLFTGLLDPVLSTSIYSHIDFDDITLEAVDTSVSLDVPIPVNMAYPAAVDGDPYALYDPDDLAHSLLFRILTEAGWAANIAPNAPVLSRTVLNLTISEEEYSWRELLDTLLYEYLHVLYVQPDGKITWIPWSSDTETETVITSDDILSNPPLCPARKYETYDGARIVFPRTEILDDVRLWEGSLPTSDDQSSSPYPGFSGEPMAAGDYWPEDSDILEIWQDYSKEWMDIPYLEGANRLENDDLSLISSSDQYITDGKDTEVLVDLSEFCPKKARLRYRNSSDEIKKLYFSYIYGKALIRSAKLTATLPANAEDPDEYTSRFIFTQAAADALVHAKYRMQIFADMYYSFSSEIELYPGQIVRLEHQQAGMETTLLINERSRTVGQHEVFAYTAYGVKELSIDGIVHTGKLPSVSSKRRTAFTLLSQYSVDTAGPWHSSYAEEDVYMRTSSDGGVTWSGAVRIRGVDGTDAPVYLGALPVPVAANPGDFFLYIGEEGVGYEVGHYYKYQSDGTWVETTDSQDLIAGVADALELAKTRDTFYAASVFVSLLAAQQILIHENGSIRSAKFNSDGTENPAGPEAGFYLGADGWLKAVNGEFTGVIYGTDGYFKGNFETPTIVSEPGVESVESATAAGGQSQARTICSQLQTIGISQGVVTKASGSFAAKSVAHVKYSYYESQVRDIEWVPTWNGQFPITNGSNWYNVPYYISSVTAHFSVTVFFSDGSNLGIFTEVHESDSSTSEYPEYPTINKWSDTPTGGSEYTETLTLDIYTGGDILKVLNLPTSSVGLEAGQVYVSNGALRVK